MNYLTRRERFNAAHRLYVPEWDDKKNYEVFGKCSNPNWHGHNYELFVTVKGIPDPTTGFLVNITDLSNLIKEKIIEKCDHKNLNLEVDFLNGVQPTLENLCIKFWEVLEKDIEKLKVKLHCIKICETENNMAEYYGTK